jgi:hypothetical protein
MRTLVVILALMAAGCGDDLVACTEEARSGLAVTVRDSATGVALTNGVEVVARDGAYADTARSSLIASGVYSLAVERAGTYDVTVDHPAYRQWRQAGVQVTADACHVQTVNLLARMQPRPQPAFGG